MALAKCVKLISLVGRAFYDDESVAILDFLARNNFLRDDGEHELLGWFYYLLSPSAPPLISIPHAYPTYSPSFSSSTS